MKKTRMALCLSALVMVFSYAGQAQSLKAEDIKAQMVKDWERAKAYTIEYLNTMPADKYSFKPVDSIRSFAQQMLHLSQGNVFLMSVTTEQKPPSFMMTNLENRAGVQNKDSVMKYVISSYDYCLDAVKSSDITKWGEKKKAGAFEETRWAFMMKAFEHQGHHRGQTTIYIRLQGIKPPDEKLF